MNYFSMKSLKLFLGFVFIGLFSLNAYALRCGTELIDIGDTLDHVREVCGVPDRQREWSLFSYYYNVSTATPMAELIYAKPMGSGYSVLVFRDYKLLSIDFKR